ncbi:MAG: hypothetical protein HRU15_00565 [Planctomycetes bacterium]|nr:hypothetical protein [Planctomycetota bacterium]
MSAVQYIVIRQGLPAHKVPSITAQAAVSSYLQWQDEDIVRSWMNASCARRIVVANQLMFSRIKDVSPHLILHDDNDNEAALVPKFQELYADEIINLPNWFVNA